MTYKDKIILDEIGTYISDRISIISELAYKFKSYHTGIINEENIINWLLQFGTLKNIQIAFNLLSNINFLDTDKIVSLIITSYNSITTSNISDLYICPIGNLHDSASMLIYSIGKKLNIPEEQLSHKLFTIDRLISNLSNISGKGIVFIDDNITSGTQLKRFFSELLSDSVEHREHITSPLKTNERDIIKNLKIYYCVAIELLSSNNIISELKSEYSLKHFEIISGFKDYNNYLKYGNRLWLNEIEANYAEELIKNISYELFTDKKDKWGKTKTNDRLCGYGNLGKLIVFSHNIPKSLLPIFWKYGIYNSKNWFPLFAERNEWEKYKSDILNTDPYISYVAKNILSGLFGKPLPICSGFLIVNKHRTKEVIINIPNDNIINKVIDYKTRNLLPLDHEGQKTAGNESYGIRSLEALVGKDYDRFNKKVDLYNQSIDEYKLKIKSVLPILCTRFTLPIRVYNNGNGTANEVILKLSIPNEIEFFEDIKVIIPIRPQKPDPPTAIYSMNFPKPELSYLESITNNLKDNRKSENKYKITYEDGNKIIIIYFGKILQHTFRDYEIEHFVLVQNISTINIDYSIIFEEAKYSINEIFKLKFEKDEFLDEYFFNLLEIK